MGTSYNNLIKWEITQQSLKNPSEDVGSFPGGLIEISAPMVVFPVNMMTSWHKIITQSRLFRSPSRYAFKVSDSLNKFSRIQIQQIVRHLSVWTNVLALERIQKVFHHNFASKIFRITGHEDLD